MAVTLATGTITQLTAAGTSTEMDIANAYAAAISIKHVNGTGTITTGGIVRVEISYDGTNWETDITFTFGLTASATEFRTYPPPADGLPIDAVRLVWTVPVGSTGHTLDARFGKATAL
jgi:hypothetical protein